MACIVICELIVDEVALAAALKSGALGGAAESNERVSRVIADKVLEALR